MKKIKGLDASISQLREMLDDGGIEPHQKESVSRAMEVLKQLRKTPLTRKDKIFERVGRVTKELVDAFIRRKKS
jgi:hypothetical protein